MRDEIADVITQDQEKIPSPEKIEIIENEDESSTKKTLDEYLGSKTNN